MKNIYIILFLITFQSTNAQVLWSDDFDSYPIGLLSTDNKGVKPGHGNWYVDSRPGQIQIVPETGRGNVMALGWLNGVTVDDAFQENIDLLWNSRDKSKNILKLEYQLRLFKYDVQYYSTDIYSI